MKKSYSNIAPSQGHIRRWIAVDDHPEFMLQYEQVGLG